MAIDRTAAVVAILITVAGAASGMRLSSDAAAATESATLASVPQQARPFRHAVHTRLACVECHPTGEQHRTPKVWTPADCAACHHDPGRDFGCTSCHQPSAIAGPRTVPVSMSLTVWTDPRVRDLPFDHDIHAARACQECHGPAVTQDPRTACANCHGQHHVPEASCGRCHRPTAPGVHARPAHLSCTGSACHTLDGVERPPLSRTMCLLCHAEQADHQPGGECHLCHQIPTSGRRSSGSP